MVVFNPDRESIVFVLRSTMLVLALGRVWAFSRRCLGSMADTTREIVSRRRPLGVVLLGFSPLCLCAWAGMRVQSSLFGVQ